MRFYQQYFSTVPNLIFGGQMLKHVLKLKLRVAGLITLRTKLLFVYDGLCRSVQNVMM